MNEARVRVAFFDNRIAAEIARARLESIGIQSWIEADDAGGAYPQLQVAGVRLLVPASEEDRALEALSEGSAVDESDTEEIDESAADSPMRVRPRFGSFLLLLIGVVLGFVLNELDLVESRRSSDSPRAGDDENGDGKLDAWYDYNQGVLSRARYDRNFDEVPDYWESYEYGRVVATESDNNFDGHADAWLRYRNSNVSDVEEDLDHNGVPDLFSSYHYGVPVSSLLRPNRGLPEREDRYVDGVLREVFAITPAGQRRLIRVFDDVGRELPAPP